MRKLICEATETERPLGVPANESPCQSWDQGRPLRSPLTKGGVPASSGMGSRCRRFLGSLIRGLLIVATLGSPVGGLVISLTGCAGQGVDSRQKIVDSTLSSKTEEPVEEKAVDNEIAKLIKQLGDDDWQTREDATKKLIEIGIPAIKPLLEHQKEAKDPEIKVRIPLCLDGIAPKLLGKAVNTLREVKTYQATINAKSQCKDEPQEMEMVKSVVFKQPNKLRISTKYNKSETLNIYDGKYKWTYRVGTKYYQKEKAPRDILNSMVMPGQSFSVKETVKWQRNERIEEKRTQFLVFNGFHVFGEGQKIGLNRLVDSMVMPGHKETVKWQGTETIRDKLTYIVIEDIVYFMDDDQEPDPNSAKVITFKKWFSTQDYQILKTLYTSGPISYTESYSAIKLNEEIPDTMFTFVPPEGTKLRANKRSAKCLKCKNNVRYLFKTLAMHSTHSYPPAGKVLPVLAKFLNKVGEKEWTRLFICPSSEDKLNSDKLTDEDIIKFSSYEATEDEITDATDEDKPIIWDKEGNHIGFRTVTFFDGTIEQVNEDEFQKLMEQFEGKYKER